MLDVRRQNGVNTVDVVEGVQAKLAILNRQLPAGREGQCRQGTGHLHQELGRSARRAPHARQPAGLLIVFLFIRNWRTVLISSIAIPTSIITTFTLMRMMGFTLNSMTLLGLTLAVGIVIDDAIIVLENIYRYIERRACRRWRRLSRNPRNRGRRLATTISLVIIFVPIAFMTGYARRYLNQFGWTMAFSIMVSMLVAFTLTPTLSARLLRKRQEAGKRKAA